MSGSSVSSRAKGYSLCLGARSLTHQLREVCLNLATNKFTMAVREWLTKLAALKPLILECLVLFPSCYCVVESSILLLFEHFLSRTDNSCCLCILTHH